MTNKEKLFCDEYLVDLNGTQAAIRAGYSENSATEIASQNLTKLHIKEYIQERQKVLQEIVEIDQVWILNEFKELLVKTKEDSKYSESTKILENIGKHLGFYATDNKQKQPIITHPDWFDDKKE